MKAIKIMCGILLISGCQSNIYDPAYVCPNLITDQQYQGVMSRIEAIHVLPLNEVRARCQQGNVTGCTLSGEEGFIIYAWDLYEAQVVQHEICHAYRVLYLGRSLEDEAAHIGWLPTN